MPSNSGPDGVARVMGCRPARLVEVNVSASASASTAVSTMRTSPVLLGPRRRLCLGRFPERQTVSYAAELEFLEQPVQHGGVGLPEPCAPQVEVNRQVGDDARELAREERQLVL